jgi:pilus assembly protein CpaE
MNDRPSNRETQPLVRAITPTAMIFIRDRDAESAVHQSLNSLGIRDAEFISGNIQNAVSDLAKRPSPRLLIVDISGVDDPATHVNELAEVCEPNTGIVVIGDSNDIILYRHLKQAGVVEYFFKPLIGDLVTRTCSTILNRGGEPQISRGGKLIFIIGVRGGVGATTIATNTAWCLAETRQRWVMLLDLDLQNGDAALQLDVNPSHALREAFEHPDRVNKLFLERAVIHVHHRIDLLASLEPLSESMALQEDAVQQLLKNLLHRYRFVFVDVPPTIGVNLVKILRLPSTCVLVSNGSLASARDVARWRELIGSDTPERNTLHLLNQHGAPASLPDAEFARAAGRSPDITVPFDREIAIGSNLGVKGTQKCATLKRGLAPLVRNLSGEQADTSRSVLSRLFG